MARIAALRHPAVVVLGALALASMGGWLAVSVVTSRGQFGTARAGTASPALPRALDVSGAVPSDAGWQPAGPAIAAYLDDDDEQQWWVFVGANRSTYRRLVIGEYGPDQSSLHANTLLSPDGRAVARVSSEGNSRALWMRDLVDGTRRSVPGIRLTASDAVLAWSPDSKSLAVRAGGKLTVVEVASGAPTAFDMRVESAAFSPDGTRLAVGVGSSLSIVNRSGTIAAPSTLIGDGHAIARAGWSLDGAAIALQSPRGMATFDVARRRVTQAPGSTGLAALAWRDHNTIVASRGAQVTTTHDSTSISYDRSLVAHDLSSGQSLYLASAPDSFGSIDGVQLATALVPSMTVVDTGGIDRGQPRIWYAALLLCMLTAALAGFWWPRPGSARRATAAYQNALEIRAGLAPIGALMAGITVLTVPVFLYARPDVLPQLGSVPLLSAAMLLCALLLRPRGRRARSTADDRSLAGVGV